MEKKNKKRNKNIQVEEKDNSNVDVEQLKEELDKYLKINEEISKSKEKESEQIKKIKNKGVDKIKELKELKEENKIDDLLAESIENVKALTNSEILASQNKIKIDNLTKENNQLNDNINALNSKITSSDKYNKMLLEKCNQLKEEKKAVQYEEAEKRNELVKKCEDFMKDMQTKFEKEIPEKELLIKENDELRQKLQETKVLIEEKLDFANKSKSMLEESLKSGMEAKLKELVEKENHHQAENVHLKAQLNLYNTKFEELTKSIQTYNSHYENLRKEIDKVSYFFFY